MNSNQSKIVLGINGWGPQRVSGYQIQPGTIRKMGFAEEQARVEEKPLEGSRARVTA